ncbi:MAG: LemA family protein [Candidatus Borkfalkiaceae bacterium]|nr:LemA family protein [Clostridia bacterium]MDY6223271.1 LemA family protein [Christensenellaceae bacterium]
MLNSLLIGGGVIALIAVAVVLLLIVIFAVWWIKTSNALIRLNNKAEEAWASIDVFLKKRYDLIPNLVETVKGYAKHENETLNNVVAARNASGAAKTPEEKMQAANALNSSLKVLLNAVHEAYPELKADANFRDLQQQLKNLEGELESARRYYNGVVKTFNNKIQVFPSSIVANKKGYEKKKYFELENAEERQNVKVQF